MKPCRRLLTIGAPHPAASVIHPGASAFPEGADDEDLGCGCCGAELLIGWTLRSAGRRLVVDAQLVVECPNCRTLNVVPAARLAEEPREGLVAVDPEVAGLYIRK